MPAPVVSHLADIVGDVDLCGRPKKSPWSQGERRGSQIPSWPGYLELPESGELARQAHLAVDALADCTCCSRQCHADQRRGDSP